MSFYRQLIEDYLNLNKNSLLFIKNFKNRINESYYVKPVKKIITSDFTFIYFPKIKKQKKECPLCFVNIYQNKELKIFPLKLADRFFYLMPSYKEYVPLHFVLVDFIHQKMTISANTINYFISFVKLFPSLTICTNCDLPFIGGSVKEHLHYQIGIMNMPLFKKDGFHIKDNIYEIDWYIKAFLIKDSDEKALKKSYLELFEAYHNDTTSLNIILKIINKEYYLYLIVRSIKNIKKLLEYQDFKDGIGVFEAMGHFILEENNYSLEKTIALCQEILKNA